MADLRDEPYWEDFTRVLEWARTNTHSALWSCLAAHAAILHMDGINRRKSEEKNFGVFDCARVSNHPVTLGLPSLFQVPHSRWNGVAEEDLLLLADAQTSGGLLIAGEIPGAPVIGELRPGAEATITVR